MQTMSLLFQAQQYKLLYVLFVSAHLYLTVGRLFHWTTIFGKPKRFIILKAIFYIPNTKVVQPCRQLDLSRSWKFLWASFNVIIINIYFIYWLSLVLQSHSLSHSWKTYSACAAPPPLLDVIKILFVTKVNIAPTNDIIINSHVDFFSNKLIRQLIFWILTATSRVGPLFVFL